jgi:hypothetical protein
MNKNIINEMGTLAIQIHQNKTDLEILEKKYNDLNTQAVLLQTIKNEGFEIIKKTTTGPDSTDKTADNND